MKINYIAFIFVFILLGWQVAIAQEAGDSSVETQSDFVPSPQASPEELLVGFLDKVYDLLEKDTEVQEKLDEFSAWSGDYINFYLISRFVAGPSWRSFSSEQRKNFQKAFTNYIVLKFFPLVQEHMERGKLKIEKVTDVKKDRNYLVASEVTRSSGGNLVLEWQIVRRKKTDSYKIADLSLEGVSLIVNWRGEFSDIISNQGPDKTIEFLKNKSNELKENLEEGTD